MANCFLTKMHMKFNDPPPRLSLISPYDSGTYTQNDLDMRRKAEILKHQAESTKTNSKLTQKQKFSQIVRSNTASSKLKADCDSSIILTPSSSSDVPGKAVQLYLDPSVPLYNFTNSITSTFGEMEKVILLPWIFHVNDLTTTLPVNGEVTNIATLEILRAIVNPISKFSISIPYVNNSSTSKVTVKILFGGVEIAYLKEIPAPIINSTTILVDDIFLYTSPGYFYEFYVGVITTSLSTTINGTILITEHNYTPA